MKRLFAVQACLLGVLLLSCGHQGARSDRSFDVIREMVKGKSATEVERMLGKPDSRQAMLLSGERWIWWNYTYLDGNDYPPEERGQVVHLEIIFERDGELRDPTRAIPAQLRTTDPLSVSYTVSSDKSDSP